MHKNRLLPIWIALAAMLAAAPGAPGKASGQETPKKALDHDAYDIWKQIKSSSISRDGQWAWYTLQPGKGDAELKIRQLHGAKAYTAVRGASARCDYSGKFAVYLVQPDPEAVKTARRAKKKSEEIPKASLVILELGSGKSISIPRVKSFAIPEKAGGWAACLLEKPEPPPELKTDRVSTKTGPESTLSEERAKAPQPNPTEAKTPQPAAVGKPASGGAPAGAQPPPKEKKKDVGTVLVLRHQESGVEFRYPDVTSYAFSKDGKRLAWAASAEQPAADGVFVATLPRVQVRQVASGRGHYQSLTFDEAGKQLAFLTDRDDFASEQPAWSAFLWRDGGGAAERVASIDTRGLPQGWWIPADASPSFSKDGKRLFLDTAPRPKPAAKQDEKSKQQDEDEKKDDEKKDDEEKEVQVDIWHWQDPLLQPMQLLQAERERKRTYRAVVNLASGRLVQLANREAPNVTLGDEGNADVALGVSDMPYRMDASWDSPGYSDVYLVDVNSGARRLVLRKTQFSPSLSPKGNWLYWWSSPESAWCGMSVKQGRPRNLTKAIPHPLYDELHDTPAPPPPYGTAGWVGDDQALLVYDRYDIWRVDPKSNSPPTCLTGEAGRRSDIRFRRVQEDPEARTIDLKQRMLLATFHQKTKSSGFYRARPQDGNAPEKLIMLDEALDFVCKSPLSDEVLLTRSTFRRFPDLWTCTTDFGNMTQVSDANPQQRDYRWGDAELVEWTSLDGQPLQGILYKPDGFNPSTKYPLLVYFYERNADRLHRHVIPEPSRSNVNVAFFVSRGYLLFVPDIPYRIGRPGQSAVNAVLPGVASLVNRGFVKQNAIGVQGHSWGGYQVAYLVTRTNIFAAAEAGAPVSNMTSAYGGIRWSTGMSRMWQYEKAQSRIGGTLWNAQQKFVENSPLFAADQIETPLLMLHNDKDGAVPWYQGIELFVALRRLAKPAWLINYNEDDHQLTEEENQRDWSVRLQQFFDHYLKGAPAPVWLAKGVPALDKGETLGLELADPAKQQRK